MSYGKIYGKRISRRRRMIFTGLCSTMANAFLE